MFYKNLSYIIILSVMQWCVTVIILDINFGIMLYENLSYLFILSVMQCCATVIILDINNIIIIMTLEESLYYIFLVFRHFGKKCSLFCRIIKKFRRSSIKSRCCMQWCLTFFVLNIYTCIISAKHLD